MNLEKLQGGTILLLGKTRSLDLDEFRALLHVKGVAYKEAYEEGVTLVVEGRMMNPYEQEEVERLHNRGAHFVGIDAIERALCENIAHETLMMSLKLSNDQAKIRRFLQNPHIDDAFFLQLLRLYDWRREGFFENDDNRDVTAAIVRRFYDNIERNHNVEYSPSGLMHLLAQTSSGELVNTLFSLAPVQRALKTESDRMTHALLRAFALHGALDETSVAKIIRFGDKPLLEDVAMRKELSVALQKKLLERGLSLRLIENGALDIALAKELLERGEYVEEIVRHAAIDENIFQTYIATHAPLLAHNPHITPAMAQEIFLTCKACAVALAANEAIDETLIEALLALENSEVTAALVEGGRLTSAELETLYGDTNLHVSLAKSASTPAALLQELASSSDEAVVTAVAKNENTPIDVLYQLQLDARYARAVRENESFGRHIQSENIGWL